MKEPEDYVSDEKIQDDDIEESSTSSPLEVILVSMEFTDVFPEQYSVSPPHPCDYGVWKCFIWRPLR